MKHGYAVIVAALAAFLGAATATARESAWELERQERGIAVYSRDVAGSRLVEVKGTVRIDAPARQVMALMGDGNGCLEWRAMCKSSEVLDVISENERRVYMVFDMPWPFSDRDMILWMTWTNNPESATAVIDIESIDADRPAKGKVRAEARGRFVIDASDDAQTDFLYVMHMELGGNLPAAVVNGRLVKTTFEDLSRLKQLAEGS